MITVALLIAVAATAAFVVVVIGIRANERRAGLPCPARGRADAFGARTRRPARVARRRAIVPISSLAGRTSCDQWLKYWQTQ